MYPMRKSQTVHSWPTLPNAGSSVPTPVTPSSSPLGSRQGPPARAETIQLADQNPDPHLPFPFSIFF